MSAAPRPPTPLAVLDDALDLDPWRAELDLQFFVARGRTFLVRKHTGPLVVQRVLYPEGPTVCQAIVIHPPGGIAEGDELRLNVHVNPGGFAQLTTPGATKWYRSTGQRASQHVVMFIDDACLEWLPQETIVFDAARPQMTTEIELRGRARYLGWEILCLGRRASGERFLRGQLRQVTRVHHDGHLLFCERSHLSGDDPKLSSEIGMAGRHVTGTLLLAGDTVHRTTLDACRNVRPRERDARVGLSTLPGLLLARYLGDSGESARAYFIELFRILRPAHLGREAILPRIWST